VEQPAVTNSDTAPNRIAACCDVLSIRIIKGSAPYFAHPDLTSTNIAKKPILLY
jgi:hypothetical protein